MNVWEFGEIRRDETLYADGTRVPHLDFDVILDGEVVGRLNVHMHRHRGRDKRVDASFGVTAVVFGGKL